MPPKRAFYIAQDTPNVSPKLGPQIDPPSMFPLSSSGSSSRGLPLPGGVGGGGGGIGVPRTIRRPKKILYLAVIIALLYWFGVRHGLGSERANQLPLGFAPDHGTRHRPRTMNMARNGLATLLPLRRGKTPEHPFYELMEKGEEKWRDLVRRQSKDVVEATRVYRRRYGMDPPYGFGEWFAWSKKNDVQLVDEYDLMMRDIITQHALEPETYLNRSQGISKDAFTYTINLADREVGLSGPRKSNPRPKKLAAMIQGFAHDLPADVKVHISGSDHDMSSVVLGKDQRKRAVELAHQGRHLTAEELKHFEDPRRTPAWGWFKACPLESPANRRPDSEYATDGTKSFIYDHVATMDFCEFPQLRRLHGALCHDREDRSPSFIKPWLVHSKLPGDASFLLPPIEGFTNFTQKDLTGLGRWEDKLDPRVHWRGAATGGICDMNDWRESHRLRLHLKFNGKKGDDPEWTKSTNTVMQPDGRGGYVSVQRTTAELAKGYGDVKLAGGPVQCKETPVLCEEIKAEIDFAPQVSPKNTWMFRYAMDVDGNGWSERFHRLLTSASPVLKMTMFADWHMDRLIPWYHYIPIQPDYSDVYDVLSFFVGPMREDGSVDHSLGHEYLGRKIGQAGQDFSLKHWRWVDMQAYMYRLLLELNRLESLDRSKMSYTMAQAQGDLDASIAAAAKPK